MRLTNFPADAITVRFRNQRLKDVGVYFYGKKKTSTWGNTSTGTPYTYIDKKLRVTLPFTTRNGNLLVINSKESYLQTWTWRVLK